VEVALTSYFGQSHSRRIRVWNPIVIRWKGQVTTMRIEAVIKKEEKVDPRRPQDKSYYASLTLLSSEGREYGVPRYFSGFAEVGDLLKGEAGVTHEQLQDRLTRYDRGDEVRILLDLDEGAIGRLGFDPRAA